MSEDKRKPRCWNCKFAGEQFKIADKKHLHCESPSMNKRFEEDETTSPWDSLRECYSTCKEHEFKPKPNESN
tara:strand:+ start:1987 stop:2202 length:216 start_codon:yes stop_codon:yes gene_type:complete